MSENEKKVMLELVDMTKKYGNGGTVMVKPIRKCVFTHKKVSIFRS